MYAPSVWLIRKGWLTGEDFSKKHPHLDSVRWGYNLLAILWILISLVITGGWIENTNTADLGPLFILIPMIGLQLLKGVIELLFGVSVRLATRHPKRIKLIILKLRLHYRYKFLYLPEKLRKLGLLRLIFAAVFGGLAVIVYLVDITRFF